MKHLVVQNFGPVVDAEIKIKSFNLFIGEQSIGKSTLAKLVTIFTDYVNLFMIKAAGSEIWKLIMDAYDLGMYSNHPYKINYIDDELDGAFVKVEVNKGIVFCSVTDSEHNELDYKQAFQRIVSAKPFYHKDTMDKLKDMEITSETLPTFFSYLRNSLYIPAERIVGAQLNKLLPIISMGKEQLSMNMLRYLTELNNAKVKYNNYRLDLLDVSYLKKDEDDWVVLDNEEHLPLKYASSGIQSTLPLLLVLVYGAETKDYDSFVVEEPECNLFPQKQVDLLNFMVKAIYQNNRMLTITTHSPYLLSSLNVMMLAYRLNQEDTMKNKIANILDSDCMLNPEDVSVYFLGDKEQYCKSMISEQTGLVSVNQLDSVSEYVGDQFDQLYDLYVQYKRRQS